MTDFSSLPLREFIDRAASDAPVPGGGGIAALAGALGGAMAAMAANFTVGKPKFAEHDALMRETLAGLEPLIASLRLAVDADAEAFTGIAAAYRLSRDDDAAKAARKAAINAALAASMRVPLGVVRDALRAAELLPPLAGAGNPNLLSDVEVAGVMLEAAARAGRVNVLVNSGQLDSEEARAAERECDAAVARVAELSAEAAAVIARRKGGS